MVVTIVASRPEHESAVVDMVRALCAEAKCERWWPFDEPSVRRIMSAPVINGPCRLVALGDDGVPVGCLIGVLSPVPFSQQTLMANELALYVLPGQRGKGVGRQLVEEFRMWAKTAGARIMAIGNNFGCSDFAIEQLAASVGMVPIERIFGKEIL